MKKLSICLILLFTGMSIQTANAQASDKSQRMIGYSLQTIKVPGQSCMTKRTIEETALGVTGIKTAVYNESTQVLTVRYSIFKKEALSEVKKIFTDRDLSIKQDALADSINTHCCCCQRRNS